LPQYQVDVDRRSEAVAERRQREYHKAARRRQERQNDAADPRKKRHSARTAIDPRVAPAEQRQHLVADSAGGFGRIVDAVTVVQ